MDRTNEGLYGYDWSFHRHNEERDHLYPREGSAEEGSQEVGIDEVRTVRVSAILIVCCLRGRIGVLEGRIVGRDMLRWRGRGRVVEGGVKVVCGDVKTILCSPRISIASGRVMVFRSLCTMSPALLWRSEGRVGDELIRMRIGTSGGSGMQRRGVHGDGEDTHLGKEADGVDAMDTTNDSSSNPSWPSRFDTSPEAGEDTTQKSKNSVTTKETKKTTELGLGPADGVVGEFHGQIRELPDLEGKDEEALSEADYKNLAYKAGKRVAESDKETSGHLNGILSSRAGVGSASDPEDYGKAQKAVIYPPSRAYLDGSKDAEASLASFYDTAEFKSMFGNVLKGMEERGEKWEEDGIAEMDAEVEAAQSKQSQITQEPVAKIEAVRSKALEQMQKQRREIDTKKWQELEQEDEEKARWDSLTEKERNLERAASAKAAKKKAAKEAAAKKVEDREMKRHSREAREARANEKTKAKMEKEAAVLAQAVEKARKSSKQQRPDDKVAEMKHRIARLAKEIMVKENGEINASQTAEGILDDGVAINESSVPIEDLDKLAEEHEIQTVLKKIDFDGERRQDVDEFMSEPPLLEAIAKAARNEFGDTLPEGLLDEAEYSVYQRLYGSPSRFTSVEEDNPADKEGPERNLLLRQAADGSLEEVDYVLPDELDQIVDDDADFEEEDALGDEQDDLVEEDSGDVEDFDWVKLDDPFFTPQEGDEIALTFDEYATEKGDRPLTKEEALEKLMNEWPGDEYIRTHAFTRSGRYGTNPSTLPLPRAAFIDPVQKMLAPLANKHLAEAAQKSLGGLGIPLSPNTPRIGMRLEMQPIPLTSFQTKMSDREADVYMSAVMPQTYASLTSILVEVRKRLGASWLQKLLKKEGGPLIMDAGAGGAGVIAWRELLRAEWEGMHKVDGSEPTASDDGIIPELMSEEPKPTPPPVPFGRSTVVTGSDPLRQRISKILENTTFIPRIPDYVDPHELVGPQPRKKYDIILAPHTLWPIKEEYQRKGVVETLWSLLNPNGGILVIMEKGVPRGFEVVAGARDMLLKRHIASPGSESYETPLDDQKREGVGRWTEKEKGCIIAPCTNHTACPLYKIPGTAKGRKDWCYFSQRYTRPPALMTVLGARARNHDDVEYSYVAVQRGVDQRTPEGDSLFGRGFVQGASATAQALDGYGPSWSRDTEEHDEGEVPDGEPDNVETSPQLEDREAPHPLSLPRTILTPLKRKGNVLIDVCTPSGTYERWLVNKRNGRQIFRDARKARWGDLWALGARSAGDRRINVGVIEDRKKEGIRKDRKAGRKGLGKRGKGRWADGDGGKMGMGQGGRKGWRGDGIKKGVIMRPGEEDD